MDKESASKILNLDVESTPTEIENRYNIIVKRMKTEGVYFSKALERECTAAEVNDAYYTMMGIDIRDEAEKIEDEGEREAFLVKRKIKTFFQYNWAFILVGAFFLAIFSYAIYISATAEAPDVTMAFYGSYFTEGFDSLEKAFESDNPELGNVSMRSILMDRSLENSVQNENRTQLRSMIVAKTLDVLILDMDTYRELAQSNYLMEIGEYLQDEQYELEKERSSVLAIEEVGNKKSYYGIDITGLDMFDVYGIGGDEFILAVSISSQNTNGACDIVDYIMGIRAAEAE